MPVLPPKQPQPHKQKQSHMVSVIEAHSFVKINSKVQEKHLSASTNNKGAVHGTFTEKTPKEKSRSVRLSRANITNYLNKL